MHEVPGLLKMTRHEQRRRIRMKLDLAQTAVYAIGDIHGCFQELKSLEERIVADAQSISERKLIVMLGDYVDRGPSSAQVLDHLMGPPPEDFERICLIGNHEMIMLDYLDGRARLADWLALGAGATLQSYGIELDTLATHPQSDRQLDEEIRAAIPISHVAFLRSLPIMVETRELVLVHAGLRPQIDLERQSDQDLVWIRSDFYEATDKLDRWVVHGHTPVPEARPEGKRVNIDTGACYTGRLTAVRIWRGKGRFLSSAREDRSGSEIKIPAQAPFPHPDL